MPDTLYDQMLAKAAALGAEQGSQPTAQPSQESKPGGISKAALSTWLGGAGADMGTTIAALSKDGYKEANPMVSWAGKAAVPAGAGMELAGVLLAKKLLANHPKILNGALMGLGALHGGLALKNLNTMSGSNPGDVSGSKPEEKTYINPDYFQNGGNQ